MQFRLLLGFVFGFEEMDDGVETAGETVTARCLIACPRKGLKRQKYKFERNFLLTIPILHDIIHPTSKWELEAFLFNADK